MRRSLMRIAALPVAALMLAACASGGGAVWTYAPQTPAPGGGSGEPSAAPSQPTTGGASLGTLELSAFDVGFKPKEFTVDKAGTYTIKFSNTGQIPHDFTPEGGSATTVDPGQTATFDVNVPEAGLKFSCTVPGHAAAGMTGTIMVKGGDTSGTGGDSHGGASPDTGAVQPDPNAPKYELYDATAPKVLEGTTHDIDLVVEEKLMTVAEGYQQAVWTFNGSVPGPVIRVHQGDTIRIHLKNPATSKLSHSIDFHASQVAWNDEMTSIKPGEEKVYEWRADYAGVWMYHCGTAPALHHIANGMYGMVIVEPKGGFAPVDHEFALVQSEWYLGPQGQPVDLAKAATGNPAPDFVVFNGVANQYLDNPMKVETGKSVRIFLLDAGPSIDSSFHIVGTIFNTVIKEGIQLTPTNPGHFGSQAVDLSPAQGAVIEFATPEDGLYPVVTHAFNFVGRGALGLVQAGDGDPLK